MFSFGTYQKDIFKNEITPPWPYKTWEAKKNAKKEELPVRKTELFYPDFDNDVFAGVL